MSTVEAFGPSLITLAHDLPTLGFDKWWVGGPRDAMPSPLEDSSEGGRGNFG